MRSLKDKTDAMKIDELQNAMVERFKELLPELAACKKHSGRFDLNELAALSTKTPALFVSMLGIRTVEERGDDRVDLHCQFAGYIVTADSKGLPRDEASKNLTEALVAWLPNKRFGIEGVGAPESIRAENLYNSKARSKAVMLAAVTWTHRVSTGESIFKEDGTLPTDVYVAGEVKERTES